MVVFVDGARNVGKSYLINKQINVYKFDFNKFINDFKLAANDSKLFYVNIGYNYTLLDMWSKDLLPKKLIVDRGILSDIVFGIMSGRISEDEGLLTLKKFDTFDFKIIYVIADEIRDDRQKDNWKYNQSIYDDISIKLLNNLDKDKYVIFKNNRDSESLDRFNSVVEYML